MTDCNRCPPSRFCGHKDADWYPLGVVRFCRPQVLYILAHLDIIRDGRWPRQPRETGYVDPGVRVQPRQTAAWEQPAQIAAEIDARLRSCGMAGKLLEYQVRLEEELDPDARKALNYVSGWRRRAVGFRQWCAIGKAREVQGAK